MPLTQFGRDLALSATLTLAVITRPAALYLGAFSGAPGDLGTSFANELSGNGYARQALASGTAMALTAHVVSPGGTVTFTASGGSWSAATYWGVFDALTVGNLLAYGLFSQSGATYALVGIDLGGAGSGYTAGDVLTLVGGTSSLAGQVIIDTVATVNSVAGVPVTFHTSRAGSYTVLPSGLLTVTGGTGTGATFTAGWASAPQSFTLNNGDSIGIAGSALQIAAL
jgi:hypothetical protein